MNLPANWKRLAWIAGGGLIVLAICLGAISFWQERTDRIRAEATIEAKQEIIGLQERTIAAIDKQVKARAEETAKAKKELQALRARPATVQEIVREIPQFVPLPGAPTFRLPDLRASNESMNQSGNGSILFDSAQAQSLRSFYLGCAEQKIDLNACRLDLGDMKAKAEAERLRADLFEDQRDAAVRAMKGGSRWQRFARNAKMLGAGFVLGVAGGIALTR